MEAILYITGGIALLALAWLFISLSRTVSAVKDLLRDVRSDLSIIVETVTDIKSQVLPILGNVNSIASNITTISNGIQAQMVTIQETIDDALDVVRGTIDDLERLKDEVVSSVEGPIQLVRTTANGTIGAIGKVVTILSRFVGKKADREPRSPRNGQAEA